jgi:hypothetical protein
MTFLGVDVLNNIKKTWMYILLGGLLPWTIFILTKNKMFFADQASVCVIAHGILNHLDMYHDYFNEKFPLLYYYEALFLNFVGDDIGGVRIVSYITFSLTFGTLFYLIAKNIQNTLLKFFYVAVIFLFFVNTKTYNAATEPSLALLFLIATLLISNQSDSNSYLRHVVVGFLMGTALGFRQHALLPAILLFIFPWHRVSRFYYLSGFFFSVSLWVGYLVYKGLFYEFIDSTILFAFYSPNALSYVVPTGFLQLAFIVTTYLFFHVIYLTRKSKKRYLAFFALSCSLPFFIRYGNTRLWPAFVVLSALIFIFSKKSLKEDTFLFNQWISIKYLAVITLIALMPYRFYLDWKKTIPYKPDLLAEYIHKKTRLNDQVMILPGRAIDYCLINRIPATKYYFIQPWFENDLMKSTIVQDIAREKASLLAVRKEFELNPAYKNINETIKKYYYLDQNAPLHESYSFYLKK